MLVLCVSAASAQTSTSSSNAYIYVTSNPTTNTYEIDGYRADSTGALTRLVGSPFWKTNKALIALAHTAHFLFVSDGENIYSFSIAANGVLKQLSSVDAAKFYGFSGVTGNPLVLDHTGATLYAGASDGVGDNEFQFFAKSSTGGLSFFGSTPDNISSRRPCFHRQQ